VIDELPVVIPEDLITALNEIDAFLKIPDAPI